MEPEGGSGGAGLAPVEGFVPLLGEECGDRGGENGGFFALEGVDFAEVFGLDGADFFFEAGFGDRGFFDVDVGMSIAQVVEQAEAIFLEGFGEVGLEGLKDFEVGETLEIVGVFDTHQPGGEGVAEVGEAEGTITMEKLDEGLV